MNKDKAHEEAIILLEEALMRIKKPQTNANGYPMQAGGAWWRLQKVMVWLAPHVTAAKDEHVFDMHGHLDENLR